MRSSKIFNRVPEMIDVDWKDVQGLVRRGFGELECAAYLLWRFKKDRDQEEAKQWITSLAGRLARADSDEETRVADPEGTSREARRKTAIGLALTTSGLKALGVSEDELAYFSIEFREGMAPRPESPGHIPRRSNLLGDFGCNSPAHWEWGGWGKHCHIDGLLILFAKDDHSLHALIAEETAAMSRVAEEIPVLLRGHMDQNFKEHFGFRDGLSNPIFEGTKRFDEASAKERRISVVKHGEFILGCRNERKDRVSHWHGPTNRDLGRHGTYLVFRQLEQDVAAFRTFIKKTAQLSGEPEEQVASYMVGRTYDGEPLVPGPIPNGSGGQPHGASRPRNDFLFHFEDRFGVACPVGAHIRRANPRDLIGPDPDTALRLSKMHRIIRRGRAYGEKLPPGALENDGKQRGLHFICLNANIAGQFEFIQHSWLNNRHFNRLYDEVDAIGHVQARVMTVQDRPTNLRIDDLPQFVTVRGGAYFFMPGIKALQALGAGADELRSVA
jgi:Dyp-type peroxidase family